jgi:large subunit ribosomal protein L32e
MKKKVPKFKRQQPLKRLKDSWRKPRGKDSKMRKGIKGKPKMPKIGYKSPAKPKDAIVVRNKADIEKLDSKKFKSVIISRTVGKRKRIEIVESAEKAGIEVLNKGKI